MTVTSEYFTRLVSEQRSAGLREEAAAYRLVRVISAVRSSARTVRRRDGRRQVRIPRQRQRPTAELRDDRRMRHDQPKPGSNGRSGDPFQCAA
jgi:hypothetical protein